MKRSVVVYFMLALSLASAVAASQEIEEQTYIYKFKNLILEAKKALRTRGYDVGELNFEMTDKYKNALEKFRRDHKIADTQDLVAPLGKETQAKLGLKFPLSCAWIKPRADEDRLWCPPEWKCEATMSIAGGPNSSTDIQGFTVTCPGRKDDFFPTSKGGTLGTGKRP